MGRIRTVKPEFFRHEELFDLEAATGLPVRLGFIGLWACCDREGRFKWRPRALKIECLPYDTCDFGAVLEALASKGMVVQYDIDGEAYGHIPSWGKHQSINQREAASVLPSPRVTEPKAPDEDANANKDGDEVQGDACDGEDAGAHMHARGEGKGKERKGREGEQHVSDTSSDADVERVYLAYPRKVGKGKALTEVRRAVAHLGTGADWPILKPPEALALLFEKVGNFARSPAGNAGDYTPHPATWFHQKRYLDDEKEWQRGLNQGHSEANRGQARFDGSLAALRRADAIDAAHEDSQVAGRPGIDAGHGDGGRATGDVLKGS